METIAYASSISFAHDVEEGTLDDSLGTFCSFHPLSKFTTSSPFTSMYFQRHISINNLSMTGRKQGS